MTGRPDYLRTAFTTASGHYIDLLNPKAEQINFYDAAEGLSKLARYSGSTPGFVYSVAEHSVRCAIAALRVTQDETLASYLLLHDVHEFLIGDDTTPKKHALGEIARAAFGDEGADAIRECLRLLAYRLDVAIHEAAGLPFPTPTEIQTKLHWWDMVLRETEWRDLMRCPAPWPSKEGAVPLIETIVPWPQGIAQQKFIAACEELLPTMRRVVPLFGRRR